MRKDVVLSAILLITATSATAANWPDRPTLRAVRVSAPPVLDGDLSDPAWQSAPEFTDFTQHDPNDGEPATLPTSLRIVYDDHAIYFGAKMTDTHRPTGYLVRRDQFTQGDFLSINIDPQHDRLSGAAFTITPANVQIDSILYNDIGEDGSWDAVWGAHAKIVEDGWIAEVRVPFSQLRFPDRPVHTWGINVTRRTTRINEWVRIVNTKKGETGFVSHFADVVGLEGIRRGKPLELVPYAVARGDFRSDVDPRDPLLSGTTDRAAAGLDLKYALTSSLTLTGTINPDFGQVEVDPAVVNLSEFETFYPEKRPFFTEGLNIFAFGDSPARSHFNFFSAPRMFYSRRIGRNPQGTVDGDFIAAPAETTILGAAKVTGKLPGGWSIGVLDALTDSETSRFANLDGSSGRVPVEPMTNYFVSRFTKELTPGSRVGVMVNAVNRDLPDELESLRESAYTVGTDGFTSFHKQSWVLEWFAVGTSVNGSREAIANTQRSSARYFQRPDADHVEFDPTRTSLDGWAGRVMLSKNTGDWRPNIQVHAFSPGFETNDAGFMQRTDMISSHALMQYSNDRPNRWFRSRNGWAGYYNNQNFDGDVLDEGVFIDHFATLANYTGYRVALFLSPEVYDDRATRGGPIVRAPDSWSTDLSFDSDDRKNVSFSVSAHLDGTGQGSWTRSGGVTVTARPRTNISLSISPYYSRSHRYAQYVTQFADAAAVETYGRRYVFAELEQESFELGTRVDWTLTSTLSLQLYLQPFIAAGDYHDYRSLVRGRDDEYTPYAGRTVNDDFNFRSLRGSAVARWEFRPGSALFLVWNENRAEEVPLGDFRFGRDFEAVANAPSHDVLLLKVSYWLPI